MSTYRICEVCGTSYKVCKSCEENYSKFYYTWRLHYCSVKCCLIGFGQKERSGNMRIQTGGKTYTLKSFDMADDKYELPDGKTLSHEDIDVFILDKEEFKKVLNHKPVTKKKKEISVDEQENE